MENETALDKDDQQERERLKTELGDEFEEPVDATPEDLQAEEDEPLTGEEEKWKKEMLQEVKDWKRDQSQYHGVEGYIADMHVSNLAQPDIELFHSFKQTEKHPSPYFRQKRDRLIRRRIRETQGDYQTAGYQFARVIESLSQTE